MLYILKECGTYRSGSPLGRRNLISSLACSIESVFRREPRSSEDNRFFNYGCTALYFAFDATFGLLIGFVIAVGIIRLHQRLHMFQGAKPALPIMLLCTVLAILVGDLAYYWLHRWQHRSPWLWATHELHHSDECVNVTSAYREHWLEIPFRNLFAAFPALVLPAPMTILPFSVLFGCAQTFFNHVNVDIHIPIFNRVFVDASTHRIHHSVRAEHIDKNFGGIFSFSDVLCRNLRQTKTGGSPINRLWPTRLPICTA